MPQQQVQQNKNANNFMNYFNSKVLPNTQIVEAIRSKLKLVFMIWSAVVSIAVLFIVFLVLTSTAITKDSLIWAIAIIVMSLIAFVVAPLMTIKPTYGMFAKEKILPSLLGFWGKFTYIPPMNPMSALYKAIKNKTGVGGFFSELFKDKKTNISVNPSVLARLLEFDCITYDDKIVGQHADVDIEVAEIATTYTSVRRDSDGKLSKSTYTSFDGVVFSVKMNKNFKGITILSYDNIDKRRAEHPVIGAKAIGSMQLADALSFGQQIANMGSAIKDVKDTVKSLQGKTPEEAEALIREKYGDNQPKTGKNQEKVSFQDVFLEDPLFTRKFKLCSTDQIEARYIFTTAFMSRFMKIAEKFNYRVRAVFINNNVYILISSAKNWFEIPFFKSCSDPNNYKEFLNDFTRLLGIVETLKLNQNIGL